MTVPFEVSSVMERELKALRNRLERMLEERERLRSELDETILCCNAMAVQIHRIETFLAGEPVIDAT